MLFDQSEFPGTFRDKPHKLLHSAVLRTDPQAQFWLLAASDLPGMWCGTFKLVLCSTIGQLWLLSEHWQLKTLAKKFPVSWKTAYISLHCDRVVLVPPLQSHPEATPVCTNLLVWCKLCFTASLPLDSWCWFSLSIKCRGNSEMKWFAMIAWKLAAELGVRHRFLWGAPYRHCFVGNVFLAMDFYKGIISLSACFSCLSFPDTTSLFSLSDLVNPIGQWEKYKGF